MADTVTIDKAYLETILRRAEFHVAGLDLSTPVDLPTVTIPRVDHVNLLRMAKEYTVLRDALFRGGITPQTLEVQPSPAVIYKAPLTAWVKVLINGEGYGQVRNDPGAAVDEDTESGGVFFSQPQKASIQISAPSEGPDRWFGNGRGPPRSGLGPRNDRPYLINRQPSYVNDDTSFLSDMDKDDHFFANLEVPKSEKQHYGRNEQRTVVMKNLSDRTTHKDLAEVIRGGALLDIYLRSHDRIASVSFLEGAAAQDFLNYAKRNDIYIHGKRVEISWNDRQFILPGHVANKIGIGATRNLIIRHVNPNITAQRLRDDLEHIHNLVVIDITFQDGDVHISLNSVHNALFARTCMMSRATYKGMKIEWYPDECAQPLPKVQHPPKKENPPAPSKKQNPMVNRFQMLNMDGTEDGSEDDEADALGEYPSIDHNKNWATAGITT